MNFEVRTTPRFEKSAKPLIKKYPSMKSDLKNFIDSLAENPEQGDELTPGVRKIRMAITSKGKGKSGGARIITYTVVTTEKHGRIYLVEIYDKSEHSTVELSVIKSIVNELEA